MGFDLYARSRYVLGHVVARNAALLFGTRAAIALTAVITLPYLVRVLGPTQWGVYVLAEALYGILATILDFGFSLSATRSVAKERHNPAALAAIGAGVIGARLLLLVAAAVVTACALALLPVLRTHGLYVAAAVGAAIAASFVPWWYFQGIEDVRYPTILTTVTRLIHTAAVFLFIRGPEDGWLVLAMTAVLNLPVVAICHVRFYETTGWQPPRLTQAMIRLREGWPLFLDQMARSVGATFNPLILGYFVTPAIVGFYGAGEKVVRVVRQLTDGASTALFPRMSLLVASRPEKAALVRRWMIAAALVGGVVIVSVVYLAAPSIVRWLLGPEYLPAVPVLRILSFTIPAAALSAVFGSQWLLPHGRDRAFASITITTGVLSVLAGVILARHMGYVGMAIAALVVEIFMMLALWIAGLGLRYREDPPAHSSSATPH